MAASRGKIAFAFAFDIDGVLVTGKEPIAGAQQTLIRLQKDKIPFIFLNNSGGVTEEANLQKLASRLGDISFEERQIVQSHTPFHALVEEYHDKTVLVIGGIGDNIRGVAAAYGFKDVVTSSDLLADEEHLHPFPEMTKDHHAKYGRKTEEKKARRVAAILIWSSPRDWCLDLQNGDKALANHGYQGDGQPKLFACNGDFTWATQHKYPRFAQGAFLEALKGIWSHITGEADLIYMLCGKPAAQTYAYGEQALQALGGKDIKKVYMIGDSVTSDIAGANNFDSRCGYEWRSILVETGIHQAGSTPAIVPNHIAHDVSAAVEWAFADAEEQD